MVDSIPAAGVRYVIGTHVDLDLHSSSLFRGHKVLRTQVEIVQVERVCPLCRA